MSPPHKRPAFDWAVSCLVRPPVVSTPRPNQGCLFSSLYCQGQRTGKKEPSGVLVSPFTRIHTKSPLWRLILLLRCWGAEPPTSGVPVIYCEKSSKKRLLLCRPWCYFEGSSAWTLLKHEKERLMNEGLLRHFSVMQNTGGLFG